ncbi:MAG: hypothetical protein M0Z53_13975 [Thermaerobacter sp.]|nr:hypothetical protein [Thermaerobacter sp.]
MVFAVGELILGLVGLGMGMAKKANRASTLIALGLTLQGGSHFFLPVAGSIGTAGEVLMLFGVGMMLAPLLRRKR